MDVFNLTLLRFFSVSKETVVHHSDIPLRHMFIQCTPSRRKIFIKKKKEEEKRKSVA